MKSWVLFVGVLAVAAAQKKPNIVFILTDDQDIELGSLEPMEKTLSLIGDQGARLPNAFVTTPVCCPSRSSILTGLYIHSHGTVNNTQVGGCSNPRWQELYEPRSYGRRLRDAGYRTFYTGKYLNEYGFPGTGGPQHIPLGWDWWAGLVGNSVYYNYDLSINGTAEHHADAENDYLPDVLREKALGFLNNSFVTNGDKPFLMVVSTPTPHGPYTPARRHIGAFAGKTAPRTPNFNVPATNAKHWMLRQPPAVLPDDVIKTVDKYYQSRWEALLAVDELVEAVVQRLDQAGVLNNTFIVYSSDHGYHFAQYGQAIDKRLPYEFDIRVPMLVRGPGIAAGSIINDPVLSIDIAPTFMEMGGIDWQNETDGTSFYPKLVQPPTEDYDRTFLVEYRGESNGQQDHCWNDPHVAECYQESACKCRDMRNNTYVCVRHYSPYRNDIYCRFEDTEDFAELYDIRQDPYELENLARPNLLRDVTPYDKQIECYKKNVAQGLSVSECLK